MTQPEVAESLIDVIWHDRLFATVHKILGLLPFICLVALLWFVGFSPSIFGMEAAHCIMFA